MMGIPSRAAAALTAFLLFGCAASQTVPLGAPGVEGMNAGHTWMSPNAKRVKRLLYLANGGDVYVYDYDSLQLLGKLTSLDAPEYDCVDAKGNVWILEQAGGSRGSGYALEFARGGTTPLRTLTTSGQPVGCSVSPNGDLAVMNQDVPE